MEEHLVQIIAELKGIHSALEGIMWVTSIGFGALVGALWVFCPGPTTHIHKEKESEPFEKFGPQ